MNLKILLNILLLFSIKLFAIDINTQSSNLEIMPKSYIYIDFDNNLSKNIIETKSFIKNSKTILSLGFSPRSALWIKFKLKNKTNKTIRKIIEYANPLTEEIEFFNGKQKIVEGTWHIPSHRSSIHPTFKITLKAKEERIFFLKTHSTISTVIAQLTLWNIYDFQEKDTNQKILIFLFFTIMLTLLLYNSFIYLFTKDRAYLYYILYLIAIIINESTYTGVAQLYILSSFWTIVLTKYIMILTAFLIVTIILFTREFLHTSQFNRLDRLLKIAIYFVPILSLLSCNNFLFNSNIIILFLPLGGLIIFIGFYTLFHGVKEARFYVIGWSMVLIALIITNLQTLGILMINEYVKYINDFSFIAETFLFSIALAHRIKITNEKLFTLQKNEQERLKKLVTNKTQELKKALEKEELLYRELNHRVKNNFQMILSLIKLQILKSTNKSIKSELTVMRDRINSISHLYETLQIGGDKDIDTKHYFENIIDNIKLGFNKEVEIVLDIKYSLSIDKIIYCGLILNELITNSFKYAFEKNGLIEVSIYQNEDIVYFIIKDNGSGYPSIINNNSLGIIIVQTLVDKQLLGTIKRYTKDKEGVEYIISWKI